MSSQSDTDTRISRTELLDTVSSQFSQVQSAETENNTAINTGRRGVIKTLTAGVASLVGLTGATSAQSASLSLSEKKQALGTYEAKSAIKEAFGNHEALLAELATDGILQSRSADALEFDVTYGKVDPDEDTPVVRLSAKRIDNEIIPKLEMIRNSSGGLLQIAIYPEHSHSFAFFNSNGSNDEIVEYGDGPIEPTLASNDVSPQACQHFDCCNCDPRCSGECGCFCGSTSCCASYCCY